MRSPGPAGPATAPARGPDHTRLASQLPAVYQEDEGSFAQVDAYLGLADELNHAVVEHLEDLLTALGPDATLRWPGDLAGHRAGTPAAPRAPRPLHAAVAPAWHAAWLPQLVLPVVRPARRRPALPARALQGTGCRPDRRGVHGDPLRPDERPGAQHRRPVDGEGLRRLGAARGGRRLRAA